MDVVDVVEMTGKTKEEAVEKALEFFAVGEDEVIITVLDPGSKGFLRIGQKPARVHVKLKDNPMRTAKQFIQKLTKAMGLDITVEVAMQDRTLNIDLKGQNMGVIIGKHGQTLDSLQYLVNLAINKKSENYISVIIDTENYRAKRKETLESLARSTGKKVRQSKRSVHLEPMSPGERRVIHATLQGEKNITTFSEGVEPFRNVVIAYRKEPGDNAPAFNGRDSEKRNDIEKKPDRYKRENTKNTQQRYDKHPSKSSYPKKDNYKKFIQTAESCEDE